MPVAVSAQYTLLEPLPCIEGTGNGNCSDGKTIKEISLDTYIGYIFKFSIALAAFLAVIMIIYAGFEYMLTESVISKGDAKGKIKNALTGLLMVLASYLILRTIDPRLVEINTKLDPIDIDTTQVGSFYQSLSEDFSRLTIEDGIKYQQLGNQVATKREELERIKHALENDQELTAEDRKELELEQKKLEQGIKDMESEQVGTLAGGNARIHFKSALAILHSMPTNPGLAPGEAGPYMDYYGRFNSLGKEQFDKATNAIKKYYGDAITKLVENGSIVLANKLEAEQDFYLDQLEEERVVYQVSRDYETPTGGNNREAVQAIVTRNKDLLAKADTVVMDPELLTTYKQLLQGRIDRAQASLDKNSKK